MKTALLWKKRHCCAKTPQRRGESYPMVPCCPCVSMRRNQGRLTESLNEGTHLFLRQNAVV